MLRFEKTLYKKFPEFCSQFEEIEKGLNWLQSYKTQVLVKPKSPPASVPFRAKSIYYTCLLRCQELVEAFIREVNHSNFLAAVLLSRAAMELSAYLWYARKKLEFHLANSAWNVINKTFGRLLGGSQLVGDTKPLRVSKLIQEVGKEVPYFPKHYRFLCEIVHFNVGGQSYYRKIKSNNSVSFQIPQDLTKKDISILIPSIGSSISIMKSLESAFIRMQLDSS